MFAVQITMKDIPASAALQNQIRKRAEKLTQYFDRIMSCRVVLDIPQKHKRHGKIYNARIDISVPGKELVVTHKCNEDVYIAVRDAFDAIERQLEEHGRKRHGRVKTHDDVMHGHVTKLLPDEGYGFIEGNDGNEYYFNMTNVTYPAFSSLLIGDAVEYVPASLSEGRHAHHIVRERHNNNHANHAYADM